jgi:biotin synthase
MSKKIYLCAISNIASGICNEDCKFCTQSTKYKSDIDRFYRKDIKSIVDEAKKAKANSAVGFCLVTANGSMDDKILDFVCKSAYEIKKEVDISLIACNGTASVEQLRELKKAGIDNYNHNLETSKEFYKNICTTHSWDDRYNTCLNAKEAGLNLCTGGIFGLGESDDDRVSMLKSIKELNPMSVTINFYHPNDSLPLPKETLSQDKALELISLSREFLPKAMIMIAGGRELVFGDNSYRVFDSGANAIVIGDYLTTKGESSSKELNRLKELGYEIAKECNE